MLKFGPTNHGAAATLLDLWLKENHTHRLQRLPHTSVVKGVLLSPAAKGNGFVFVSGLVAADSNGKYLPVVASVTEKTHQMIQNVKSILESSGSSLDQVIKSNECMLTSQIIFVHLDRDYEEFNEVYKQYFPHNPARTSVEVSGLPKPADLEIEVIALAN
ncbi:YjgF/Yer057p/UK114 family [Penicillium viridicatum]|nr:YjgF/Yer057p/UK114 family [Penicillium viridicatum]